jgi:hypothetical protein
MVFEGEAMEGVAWTDPVRDDSLDAVNAFDHGSDRGMDFLVTAAGVSPTDDLAYTVTRNGRLRTMRLGDQTISPERALPLIEGSFVPYQDLIIAADELLVQVSSKKEDAAQGLAASVEVVDRHSLELRRTIHMSPAANHVVYSQQLSQIFASNLHNGSISVYDSRSGEPVAHYPMVAQTLVWFVLGY